MIIQNITVSGFRGFRNSVNVPPDGSFSEDINVISGPNETGKTSLILALTRGMFDYHKTTAQEVENARPWGTELSPEIEIEFSTGGTEYRIHKSFLKSRKSILARKENGSFVNLKEGKAANKFVRNLFDAEDPSGASAPDSWGVFRALWMRQGADHLDEPELEGFSEQLRNDPDPAMTISPQEEQVIARIADEYNDLFTSTGNHRKRQDSEIHNLQQEVDDLREKKQDLAEKVEKAEDHQDQIIELEEEIREKEDERKELQDDITDLQEQNETYDELRSEQEQLQNEREALEEQRIELTEKQERWEELNDEIKELTKDTSNLDVQIEQKNDELDTLKEQIEDQKDRRNDLRQQRKELQQEIDDIREKKDLLRWTEQLKEDQERLDAVESFDEEIQQREEELEGRKIPEDDDVQKAEQLQEKRNQLQTRRESVGLTMDIEAEDEWSFEVVDSDGKSEELTLNDGDEEERHFDSQVRIHVPGKGTIVVKSGAGEVDEIVQELDKTEEELRDLFDQFGVDDLAELRSWTARAGEISKEIEKQRERKTEALSDFESREDLKQQINTVETKKERLETDLGVTADDLPDEIDAPEDQKEEKASIDDDIASIDDEIEDLQKQEEKVRKAWNKQKNERAQKEEQLKSAREDRDEYIDKYESLDELEAKTDELEEEIEEKEDELEDLDEQLPDEDEDPQQQIEQLEEEIESIEETIESKKKEKNRLIGKVEDVRDQGLSTKLNNIDEELDHKTSRLKHLRSNARGIKLLHNIFQERKEQMAREFVGPVESRMNEYLQAITGRDTRQLVLDENLSPDTLEVEGENVSYDDLTDWALSAGTKEQLFLSMRMSVARELAENEKQVLILDDVLGNTDPERHDRIKGLLRQETDHLQIFILTCNRSLYDDMTNARQIHLDRITNK